MTLGAVIIPDDDRNVLEDKLAEVTERIGKKDLHCSNLSHFQKLFFAREIIKCNLRFFGVISHKATLGVYRHRISTDDKKYYNKCVQYLLERVGWFLEARSINKRDVSIVFEKSNCDYEMMRRFLERVQSNPHHEMTKKLQNVDVSAINPKTKAEEPLLKIADLVAHSLFKCVDKHKDNYDIPEARYLKELAPRFFGHPDDEKVLGAGLYCVHSPWEAKLDPEVRQMVLDLKAVR